MQSRGFRSSDAQRNVMGQSTVDIRLVLSDSAFFTITIVAKAIFTIFDSIMIVHFSLINEI